MFLLWNVTARSRADCWPKILDLLQRRRERTRESMIGDRSKTPDGTDHRGHVSTSWFRDIHYIILFCNHRIEKI